MFLFSFTKHLRKITEKLENAINKVLPRYNILSKYRYKSKFWKSKLLLVEIMRTNIIKIKHILVKL